MKKNVNRALATVMAAALTVSLIGMPADADAAKKMKLSKKSVTVTKGKSVKVTIKNVKAKKVKKLVVTSSKKSIATVKKSGKAAFKVTGKKKGSAKVTAKVTVKGKKKATKLTLKVKVNDAKQPDVPKNSQTPATQVPVTQAPATQAPATQPPVQTGEPATQEPETSNPATQEPGTQVPSTQEPATQPPVQTADPGTSEVKVDLDLEDDTINAESQTVAEVTVSAGEVTSVDWSVKETAVASIQKNADDMKKATITGVAAGETKVIALVKVSVDGKAFEITKEADLKVVNKGEVIVKAEIESAPAEMAIGETAGISVAVTADKVAVEAGNIESVTWKVEGTAATVETDGLEAVITAKEIGEVTISVKVGVKSGEQIVYDTDTITISVIPTTYVIGKEIELEADTWNAVFLTDLAKQIKVKKTDRVEVVFSVQGSGDVKMALSPWKDIEGKSVQNLQEQAVLRAEETADGKAVFVVNEMFFRGNYSEINSIAASCTGAATVKIEKISVTPTDEVAFSVQAPAGVEIGTPAEILAEVDEGYTLEWSTSDAEVATVTGDNTKAVVTGIKKGTVTITVVVKAADGTEAAKKELELDVTEAFSGTDIKLDLATATRAAEGGTGDWEEIKDASGKLTAIKVNDESEGVSIPLPNKLAAGKKISVTIKGSFSAGATGFRVYTSPKGITGGSTNNNLGLLGDAVTEGDFTLDSLELEAGQECPTLCLRIPAWGSNIKGLTIKEISVKYL